MKIEIISVGNEVLTGRTLDSNFAFLARALEGASVRVARHTTVGDSADAIGDALKLALGRADGVVMTGGLGPTPDDMTRSAVADALRLRLERDEPVLEQIRERVKRFGRRTHPSIEAQALLPRGATAWPNRLGTAPGILIEYEEKPVILLPGVPAEMEGLTTEYVVPYLRARTGLTVETFTLRTVGVYETLLDEMIGDLPAGWTDATLAFLPSYTGVDLRVTAAGHDAAKVKAVAEQARRELRERIGDFIYAEGEQGMEEVVGEALVSRGWKIAVAESCTGGLLAKRLTDTAGSSRYFERGYVTYSNESKVALVSVDPRVIDANGAVSPPVAEQMAAGARTNADVQLGVGITGIAGPDGGSAEKPVGTVYIAVSSPQGTVSRHLKFIGPRRTIRERSAQAALEMARRHMAGLPLEPRLPGRPA